MKKVFEHLLSCFFFVKAAGGVVKKCNSEEILFIFRDGVWDLPKGHVENGETDSTAAIREVQEETGISGKIVSQEPYLTYHYYFMNGRWELKQTAWYRMESTDCVFKPQAEEGITDIRWVNPLELNEVLMNTYPNIRELMRVMISGL
ncbi:MAG: NUDIX hydrolase [Bacteroidales bacterium]|nr:NUDIX hydrolase [Bacteroidales bacterium]